MSHNPAIAQGIKVNRERMPSDELVSDTQSAINQGMNDFSGAFADMSLLREDSELNQRPVDISQQPKVEGDISRMPGQPEDTHILALDTPTQQVQQEVKQQSPKPETPKEFNTRMMREAKEAVEAENKRLKQQLEYQQQQYQQPQYQQNQRYNFAPQQQPKNELPEIADDALLEGRDFKRYLNQAKEEFRAELQGIKAESASTAAETRLKVQFPDFDRVVNKETIRDFAVAYPEEYRSMLANTDMYSAGKTAYNMIRKFGGFLEEAPAQQPSYNNYADQDRRIQENMSKPRTAARVGSQSDGSSLGQLNSYGRRTLTEADKSRVRQQLEHSRKFSY